MHGTWESRCYCVCGKRFPFQYQVLSHISDLTDDELTEHLFFLLDAAAEPTYKMSAATTAANHHQPRVSP